MSGKAAKVLITERQQVILEQMSRSATIAFRLRQRAQIILLAFEGRLNEQIEPIVELGHTIKSASGGEGGNERLND